MLMYTETRKKHTKNLSSEIRKDIGQMLELGTDIPNLKKFSQILNVAHK